MLAEKLLEAAGNSTQPTYIEDVFSTYLYTGTGSAQTITNGIDLAGKGGLVWIKGRNFASNPMLVDTDRGNTKYIRPTTTGAALTYSDALTAFNSTGFTLGTDVSNGDVNTASNTQVSWTFRKQPKFFDVVTYTGTGSAQNISHSLGSVPGCIITKNLTTAGNWGVYHRSTAATNRLLLNTTDASGANSTYWNDTTPTSTVFTVGSAVATNSTGDSYVAYIFAHDAGGFGLTGTDNVISCGSFTGLATVNLGWEPQWILYKTSGSANSGWLMVDNMRGFTSGDADPYLEANSSAAEVGGNDLLTINSTGFKNNLFASDTFIYIAIRRGPMKVPTDGTTVYSGVTRTGTGSNTSITSVPFPPDLMHSFGTSGGSLNTWFDRLRGGNGSVYGALVSSATQAENFYANSVLSLNQNGVSFGSDSTWQYVNASGTSYVNHFLRRAPSFFDEVCYTGTGTAGQTFSHNLGIAPELMIVKRRNAAGNGWATYCAPLGNTAFLYVNSTGAADSGFNQWNNTSPTATQFSVSTSSDVNASGGTYVAYLFATCSGVSKVGSYTGNGSSQTINCGFTAGARFVLIKRTDSTGDWYVWDTARGIISGNDPHLSLNTTSAEVTTDDTIDPDSTGFVVNQLSATNVNVSSATYIYLAIA